MRAIIYHLVNAYLRFPHRAGADVDDDVSLSLCAFHIFRICTASWSKLCCCVTETVLLPRDVQALDFPSCLLARFQKHLCLRVTRARGSRAPMCVRCKLYRNLRAKNAAPLMVWLMLHCPTAEHMTPASLRHISPSLALAGACVRARSLNVRGSTIVSTSVNTNVAYDGFFCDGHGMCVVGGGT